MRARELLLLADALENIPAALKEARVIGNFAYSQNESLCFTEKKIIGDAIGLFFLINPNSELRMVSNRFMRGNHAEYNGKRDEVAVKEYFGLSDEEFAWTFNAGLEPAELAEAIRKIAQGKDLEKISLPADSGAILSTKVPEVGQIVFEVYPQNGTHADGTPRITIKDPRSGQNALYVRFHKDKLLISTEEGLNFRRTIEGIQVAYE